MKLYVDISTHFTMIILQDPEVTCIYHVKPRPNLNLLSHLKRAQNHMYFLQWQPSLIQNDTDPQGEIRLEYVFFMSNLCWTFKDSGLDSVSGGWGMV